MDAGSEPIVGRQHELDRIDLLLGGLEIGVGGCVVFTAPAGGGKSFLLDHVARRCDERRVTTCRATAEAGLVAPFRLIAAALGLAFGDGSGMSIASTASFFEAGVGAGTDGASIERLLERLDRLALAAPTVLLLDDIHLADPGSVAFLEVVLDRLSMIPVGLVLAGRTGVRHPWRTRPTQCVGPMSRDGLAPKTLARSCGGVSDWSSQRIDARGRIVVARPAT